MKDSEEKEHRISNLKDMMKNVSNDKYAQDSFEEYDEMEDASDDDYEVVDAEEMIDILSKDYNKYPKEELDVNEEFIFKPGKDSEDKDAAFNNEINGEFIIKTKLEDSDLPQEPQKELDYEEEPKPEFPYDEDDFLVEKFDGMLNKNIKGYSVIAVASLILGIAFILFSIFLFNFSSPRVVDHVISGETNTTGVIFLLIGLFLTFIGIYKMRVVKNPFEDVVDSIKSVEKDNKNNKTQKDTIEQKPLANDNKEVKKVGEFDISEFKNKMDTLQGTTNNKQNTISDEEEYEKAHLDDESIDDIFAEIDDIDDVPIISVDSKEK